MKEEDVKRLIHMGCLVFLSLTVLVSVSFAEEIAVISHKNAPAQSLSRDDVKEIFLGWKTRWQDNSKITFVVMKHGDIHERFLKEYVGKTPTHFSNYWRKKVFTGKGRAPKSFTSPDEIIAYVAKTDGAVGYIPASAMEDTVRKLEIK